MGYCTSSAFFRASTPFISLKKSHFRNLILFSSFPKVWLSILAFYIPLVIPLKSNFSRNISPYWNLSFPTINIQKCVLKSWPLLIQTTNRPAHFSRFWFLARCEKLWPISREKLREMREIICSNFYAIVSPIWPTFEPRLLPFK